MLTNICVVSSNDLLRNGLTKVLSNQKNINVYLEAREINVDAIKKIKTIDNNIKLIFMCCSCKNNTSLLSQTDYDINGFIDNKQNSVEIVNAVNNVICGKEYICPSMHSVFLKKYIPAKKSITNSLSNREYQVYCMLGEGKRIKEIAKELSLSPKTVSTHKYRIFGKLKATNISQLIMYYMNERQVS
jgi:two-component system, NarL family, invasion response regulator UvrY